MSSVSNIQLKTTNYSNKKQIELPQPIISNQHYQQDTQYFPTTIKNHQLTQASSQILKICVTHGKGLHPRKFCRRWFGLENLNEYGRPRYTKEQILAMESEHGYREKCINLIARILKIKPNTIHRWGKGVEFDKIPLDKRLQYEMYLSYVDSLRVLTMNLAELNENLAVRLLHQLEKDSQE